MSLWVWARLGFLVLILMLVLAGLAYHRQAAATPSEAFARGIRVVTGGRFTPDLWLDLLVLLLVLVTVRSLALRFLGFRTNSPIEVKALDNATRNPRLNTHSLDIVFRDYLALSRLYQMPTVPGEQEADRLIEVLSAPAAKGWPGFLSSVLAYAFPRRSFVVTASLLEGDADRPCGVSLQVRRLPTLPIHLESQWSTTWERALQRAGYAVAAHIIQQTKACRRVPWSEWARRRRSLPASLFRDYQRAKQMVRERRYDEALALYHSALRQDADNIAIRYDVGQLYERLGLYPDALLTYLGLVDEIFPIRKRTLLGKQGSRGARVRSPVWWPRPRAGNRDPYVIRYRYVVVLGQGELLARALLAPEWPRLPQTGSGTTRASAAAQTDSDEEYQPWRITELLEIGRLLSDRLRDIHSGTDGAGLQELLELSTDHDDETAISDVARYLLTCADREACSLIRDVERISRSPRRFWTRGSSFLTPTAARQARLIIASRLRQLAPAADTSGLSCSELAQRAEERAAEAERQLADAGYSEDSVNWLEHYNTACHHALPLVKDRAELPHHQMHAYKAIAALDRAARHGDQVEFVMSKRYWLQAGDPDLAGLRYYSSFRAFEARVYGSPLTPTPELSKYELYRFLRALVRRAARYLEDEWRKRGEKHPAAVSHADFEDWWRQELRAWEVAIRIGRFYPQWQTRHAALESIREWLEAFRPEAPPIQYPNITRSDQLTQMGSYRLVEQRLADTEAIFAFLGTRCGRLIAGSGSPPGVYENTQDWSRYAAACSRSGKKLSRRDLTRVCRTRSAVWAALRQWAQTPGEPQQQTLEETISGLTKPPFLTTRRSGRLS